MVEDDSSNMHIFHDSLQSLIAQWAWRIQRTCPSHASPIIPQVCFLELTFHCSQLWRMQHAVLDKMEDVHLHCYVWQGASVSLSLLQRHLCNGCEALSINNMVTPLNTHCARNCTSNGLHCAPLFLIRLHLKCTLVYVVSLFLHGRGSELYRSCQCTSTHCL